MKRKLHSTPNFFPAFLLIFFAACCLLLTIPSEARDINLDDIYLLPNSSYRTKLLLAKLDGYYAVSSLLVDRNVIFAGWKSDSTIAYIRELPGSGRNVITLYNTHTKAKTEIANFFGDVLYAVVFPGGRFIAVKMLVQGKNIIPDPQISIISLSDGREKIFPSSNVLLDFTISPEGNAIITSSEKGIVSIDALSGIPKTLLPRSTLPAAFESNGTVLAYPSQDKSRWLVLSGGGGSYRSWYIDSGTTTELRPITSSLEVCWIDATYLAYRVGSPGSYNVVIHDVSRNALEIIGKDSFNTSIRFFPSIKIISWLKDGIINFYSIITKTSLTTGLEGDDVALDNSGSRFLSTLGNRLFLTDLSSLRKKNIELARIQRNVLSLYREARQKIEDHQNEYSAMYLDRKISLYEELVKAKK